MKEPVYKMKEPDYKPPVGQLLDVGITEEKFEDWLDYAALGLDESHAGELIRMATDRDFVRLGFGDCDYEGKHDVEALMWAPFHAARALGQMRLAEAVGPLIEFIDILSEDNQYWEDEDFPFIFRLIGAPAVGPLRAVLEDADRPILARAAAANSLEEIGNYHAEPRPECIAALTDQLACFRENSPEMNACLVWTLIELYADESLPVIRAAYRAKRVDLEECPWRKVTAEFGVFSDSEI